MSATISRTVESGRHRWGVAGLVHVQLLGPVRRRNLFVSWFRPGRHRWSVAAPAMRPTPLPAARVA